VTQRDLDYDLLCACARIRQIGRDGADTCGGLILERLVTCDLARLLSHVSEERIGEWQP
jgi:hypothetical protein